MKTKNYTDLQYSNRNQENTPTALYEIRPVPHLTEQVEKIKLNLLQNGYNLS